MIFRGFLIITLTLISNFAFAEDICVSEGSEKTIIFEDINDFWAKSIGNIAVLNGKKEISNKLHTAFAIGSKRSNKERFRYAEIVLNMGQGIKVATVKFLDNGNREVDVENRTFTCVPSQI